MLWAMVLLAHAGGICPPAVTPVSDAYEIGGVSAGDVLAARGAVELPLTWSFGDGRASYLHRTDSNETTAVVQLVAEPGTAVRYERVADCRRRVGIPLESSGLGLAVRGHLFVETTDGRIRFRSRAVVWIDATGWRAQVRRRWGSVRRGFRLDQVVREGHRATGLTVHVAGDSTMPQTVEAVFDGRPRRRSRRLARRRSRHQRRQFRR